MKYHLIKRDIGTNSCKRVSTFEAESEIFQTCLINGEGIMLLQKHLPVISFISLSGKFNEEWIGKKDELRYSNGSRDEIRFMSPCSISHNDIDAHVIEENGLVIRKFDLKNKYMSTCTGNKYRSKLSNYLAKDNIDTIINSCMNRYAVIYSNSLANRCFVSRGSNLEEIIGDGRRRFSVCSNYNKSSINSPMGICSYDGQVYISDTGNTCIRRIDFNKKNISVFSGNPVRDKSCFRYPTLLKINKGILYVLDENTIKVTGTSNDNIGEIYQSDSIVSYEVGDQRKLYLIEKA